MTRKELLLSYWNDLRCFCFFPKRYNAPQGKPRGYWLNVVRAYGNLQKALHNSGYHWRVITYDDGRRELAYLRVLKNGLFGGMSPAIYRGLIIPRMLTRGTFARIKNIRLAF